MKIIDTIRTRVQALLSAPGDELGRWARFLRAMIHLWWFCARRLRQHNAMAMSSALSFRTIFAMIPVIVLALLVLKTVGSRDRGREALHQALEGAGLSAVTIVHSDEPATAPAEQDIATAPLGPEPATQRVREINLADQIEQIASKVESKLTLGRLGPVGAALLIWTALTLIITIERSLNRIFEAPQARSLARRILLYWSALTLVPIVWVGATYVGEKAIDTFHQMPGVAWLMVSVGWAGPIVVGIVLLAALYTWIPNTHVGFRGALAGAMFAVPVWMLAKWGFGIYVRELVGKGSLYGAIGLLPLFLMWMNFSWLIFLFGAELAYTAANLAQMRSAEMLQRTALGPWELLAAALAVAKDFSAGKGPAGRKEIASRLDMPEDVTSRLLDRLSLSNVVCPVAGRDEAAFVLARPAETIKVSEVLDIAGREKGFAAGSRYDAGIARQVAGAQRKAGAALQEITLAELRQEGG